MDTKKQTLKALNLRTLGKKKPIYEPGTEVLPGLVRRVNGLTDYVVTRWDDFRKKYSIVYDPGAEFGRVAVLLHVYEGGRSTGDKLENDEQDESEI